MTPETLLIIAGVFALGMLPYLYIRWQQSRQVKSQCIVTAGCLMTGLLALFYISGIVASLLSIIGFFLKFFR